MHTIDYEWLVVKGSRASAQGTATINGIGGYGFMISIIDARLDPAATKDLIRIKIWDEVTGGTVIYDTQMGDPDDADPTTAIKGGSIVIHK